MSNRRIPIGINKAIKNAPIKYHGKKVGEITKVEVKEYKIVVTAKLTNCYKCGTKVEECPGIGLFCPNKKCDIADGVGFFNIEEVY